MEFRLLGHLEVVDNDENWSAPLGGVKQRAVLATLLLDANRPVATSRVIESVWEDPPTSAAHAVEVYVSNLRKAFARRSNGGERITHRNCGYVALIGAEELDLSRFRSLTRQAATASSSGDPATASRILEAALGLWRGEPLACIGGTPLAEYARHELEEERLAAVGARLDAELTLGHHAGVIDELRRLVAAHPDREPLWFRLMLALYRSGRQVEALETYARARARLVKEHGIEPSRQLRDLQRSILEQDNRLEPPAASSPQARPRVVLPSPPSSFVGRRDELEAAGSLLVNSGSRLLTVLGPGGVGKTRFAIELAQANAHHFTEVAWIGLDSLGDHALVLAEIARMLEVDRRGPDTLDDLALALADRRLLLVLDNLEHLLDAAANLHSLLARSTGLQLLVTSREPLRLSAEQRYVLPSFEAADARELFLARAKAAGASPQPADVAVDALCERLDRLPLAIELAASHTDSQTPAELLATLRRRALDLDGRRDPPDRQHTLRETLHWSYRLLDDQDQRAFRRLGVFVGGWTVEAAEAVAEADGPTLARLASKSLVLEADDRYRMLETVREYARGLLEASEDSAGTRRRHAEWYADLAATIEEPIYLLQSDAAHACYQVERPNFEVALDEVIGLGNGSLAHSLARSLAACWYTAFSPFENRRRAESVLALPGGNAVDRGHVLCLAACSSMDAGHIAEAGHILGEAEQQFEAADDPAGLSLVEYFRGSCAFAAGDFQSARDHAGHAIGLAQEARSYHLEMAGSHGLGLALVGLTMEGRTDCGEIQLADELLEGALTHAIVAGHTGEAAVRSNLALGLSVLGADERALAHAQGAVRLWEESATGHGLGAALISVAFAAGGVGDHRAGVVLLRAGLRECMRRGVALQNIDRWLIDRCEKTGTAALGDGVYEEAVLEGEQISNEEALALALSLPTRARATGPRPPRPSRRRGAAPRPAAPA